MKSLSKYVPVFAILGAGTAIYAAPEPATDPATTEAAPPPAATLSVPEMRAKSISIQAQIAEDDRYVLHLREIAKKKKDVIKLNCVNDRAVELKAQRNLADTTNTQLQASLEKNSDERLQLFVTYDSIAQRVRVLREQATTCIGEPELLKQESGVNVEHPEIPDDPTLNPFGPEFEVEQPGYASPFD